MTEKNNKNKKENYHIENNDRHLNDNKYNRKKIKVKVIQLFCN